MTIWIMILTFDFGGTKLSCATFVQDEQGAYQLDALERRASSAHANAAYDYETMLKLARHLARGHVPQAIGVSFGGPVRASDGVVILSHHVEGWENFPLRAQLENEFQARVLVDNDANVAGLGEVRFGAGQNCASVFYLTVSTGIGGGWILNGEIHRGAQELAGEIGHMVIEPNGPPCVCGRRGCLEQFASGPAIARMARKRLQQERERGEFLRARVANDLSRITARDVNDAALQGDVVAQQVMDDAARALGFAIGSAEVLMNPQRVIIGGGVSKAGAHYFENVRAAARANVMPELRAHLDIVPAKLGDDAPLWGALALVS